MVKTNLEHIPSEADVVHTRFAGIAHEAWAGWMKFLFHVSEQREDGSVVIPAGRVARWRQLISVPYEALSEDDQAGDLVEADKYLAVVQPMLEQTAAQSIALRGQVNEILFSYDDETPCQTISAGLVRIRRLLFNNEIKAASVEAK